MYEQLAGAANGDNSLRIMQVSFNHTQIFASSSYPPHTLYGLCCSSWYYGVILSQKDIMQTINKHPNAGWTAGHNRYFENYTVIKYQHLLAVGVTKTKVPFFFSVC